MLNTSAPPTGEVYDNFETPDLDSQRWQHVDLVLKDGRTWVYREPSATTGVQQGTLNIRVNQFERAHDQVQMLDNVKHMLRSTKLFELPERGSVRFSVQMAAENIDGEPHDLRNGAVGFHVVDRLGAGMVFDCIATSQRIGIVYERLPIPSVPLADAFTYVVDTPFCGVRTDARQLHTYAIVLSRESEMAHWFVDDVRLFSVRQSPFLAKRVSLGLSLLTLHPLYDGKSQSVRGQGMSGWWRNFGYSVMP